MLRGVLSAYTAMQSQVRNQEVIANNMANVSTPAFQKDIITIKSLYEAPLFRFEPYLQQALGNYTIGAQPAEVHTVHELGPIEVTNNPLDVVLPQGTYLSVETPNGERYTRRGDLEIGSDGYLKVGGFNVMGRSGPINVNQGKSVVIEKDGRVVSDGTVLDSLRIVSFSDENLLSKEGNSLFVPTNGVTPSDVKSPDLIVGSIEKSSVDPVVEMVNLIASYRTYEAAQRALQAEDDALAQAINKVGQV